MPSMVSSQIDSARKRPIIVDFMLRRTQQTVPIVIIDRALQNTGRLVLCQ